MRDNRSRKLESTLNRKMSEWDQWWYVISTADSMMSGPNPSVKDICTYLESIELAFEDRCDPVNEFKAYALRTLCRSVRKSLVHIAEEQVLKIEK